MNAKICQLPIINSTFQKVFILNAFQRLQALPSKIKTIN